MPETGGAYTIDVPIQRLGIDADKANGTLRDMIEVRASNSSPSSEEIQTGRK